MDRCAVLVDAGYLLAQAAVALGSRSAFPRRDVVLNVSEVSKALADKAQAVSGLPVLRVYWYDGAGPKGPSAEHQALALERHLKLRLGAVRPDGRQKGVDPLIVTDLVELARNRACTDVVLITGDADIVAGVEAAQSHGLKAHILGGDPLSKSVSCALRESADTCEALSSEFFASFCALAASSSERESADTCEPRSFESEAPAEPAGHDADADGRSSLDVCKETAQEHWHSIDPLRQSHLSAALRGGSGIPPEHDGRLLARARAAIGRDLDSQERRVLREELRQIALNPERY